MRRISVVVAAFIVGVVSVLVMSPAQAATYQISASLSKTWMTRNTTVDISGKLTPATANKTVAIERYKNGEWVKSKTVTTSSNGSYKATVAPPAEFFGTATYRVRTNAKGSTGAGKSKNLSINVYTWFDLAELPTQSDDSQMYFDGGGSFGLEIEGDVFGDDAWASNSDGIGKTVWDLGGACKKVSGTAGLDDSDSDPTGLGRLRIYSDAPVDYSQVFGDDDSRSLTLNIADTELLKISSIKENDENAVVGYGQPRVFCFEDLSAVS